MNNIEDLKKLETEIFAEAELELGAYEAYRMISLIKDVIKLGEHQYAKELILRSEMILDSDEPFNETPLLVELLWAYDEVKAAKWLIRSIKKAGYSSNFFYYARIATEKALDFELTAKCLEEGFNVIWENFRDGDDCNGLYSPKEYALKQIDENTWYGPNFDLEKGAIIEWKYNPVVKKIDQVHWPTLWNHTKPVMKAVYEQWEEELWGPTDYNERLLGNLEDDFKEETEWINRIKEKLK